MNANTIGSDGSQHSPLKRMLPIRIRQEHWAYIYSGTDQQAKAWWDHCKSLRKRWVKIGAVIMCAAAYWESYEDGNPGQERVGL